MANEQSNQPSTPVVKGKRPWFSSKPLPASLASGAKVTAAVAEITGLSEKDVRFFRKPFPLERDLSNFVAAYVTAWMADADLAKSSAGKAPSVDQLLSPAKGLLIRIERRIKGEWKPVDAIAADELRHRMRDVYLDYTTNAKVGPDGFYWSFLPLFKAEKNPVAATLVAVVKNLHKAVAGAKPIQVREKLVGEDEANLQIVQDKK